MLSKYWGDRGSLSRTNSMHLFHLLFDRDRQFKRTPLQSSSILSLSLISAVYPCKFVISHSDHVTGVNISRLGSAFILPHDLLCANVFLLLLQLSYSLCQERCIITCAEY